jgi:hypothetical protein
MPLLGHEAGIEQDAEVLRDGRPTHLEMSRKRVDGAGGLDEEVEHPARAGWPIAAKMSGSRLGITTMQPIYVSVCLRVKLN